MKNARKSISIFLMRTVVLVPVFTLFSCGQSSQPQPVPQQQSLQTGQTQDKIPDELKGIESNIEKIIKALDGPSVGVQEEAPKGGAQNASKPQPEANKGQDSQEQKGGQGGESGQQQGTEQKPSPQPPPDLWEKIVPMVQSLHYQWNSYMPLAAKSGATKGIIDNFSNTLNGLTTTSLGKNKTNTLLSASALYAYVPDFYSLYRTKTSPELKRIRYRIRNAALSGTTGNWTQADSDMNSLKATWSLYKNTLDKERQELANQLDFSVYELERVIRDKSQPLTDIKGRVALSNVEALEKSLEEK